MVWIPTAWIFFLLRLVTNDRQPGIRLRAALFSIPILLSCLIATNDLHGWFWKLGLLSDTLNQGLSHPALLGPAGLFNLVFSYLLTLCSVLLITWKASETRGPFLMQASILLACSVLQPASFLINAMLPYNQTIASLPPLFTNLTAFFFLIGALRYRLIELVPLRYENVTAGLRSIILVITPNNQIIYANLLASELLGRPTHELVGQSIEQAFSKYPTLLENCCKNEVLTDISLEKEDGVLLLRAACLTAARPSEIFDWPVNRDARYYQTCTGRKCILAKSVYVETIRRKVSLTN